jgi:hypothetical protein
MEKLSRIQDKISTLLKHQQLNDASGETTIEMELQGIKIGDCVIISSPLELLTEIGLNIKQSSPYEYTFVAAYSNGYVHLIGNCILRLTYKYSLSQIALFWLKINYHSLDLFHSL